MMIMIFKCPNCGAEIDIKTHVYMDLDDPICDEGAECSCGKWIGLQVELVPVVEDDEDDLE